MKLLNDWEMSKWAYEQCRDGNNIEEIRSLITNCSWAFNYCFYINNDPEVRKYIISKYYLGVVSRRWKNKDI